MIDYSSEWRPPKRRQWIYALTGILLLVLSAIIGYGYFLAARFQTYYSPLMVSIERIEKAVIDCHRIAADVARRAVVPSVDTVLQPVDEHLRNFQQILAAEAYIPKAVLADDGGIDSRQIKDFIDGAGNFRAALSRWLQSEIRTDELKQIYDESYLHLLGQAEKIEDSIFQSMERSRGRFQNSMALLIGVCIILAVWVSLTFRRYETRDLKNYLALADAHKSLQEESRERRRTEQQLKTSELLFRSVFETSPDAVVITRLKDNMLVDANRGAEELTGYSRSELVGRSILDLDVWEDLSRRQQMLEALNAAGRVDNLEAVFVSRQGRRIVGLLSGVRIELEGELHLMAVVRDITELKQAEVALRESEERFRSLFEAASDGIQLLDLDGAVLMANPAFSRFTGLTAEEIVGRPLAEFIDPDSGAFFEKSLPKVLIKGEVLHSECRVIPAEGKPMPMAFSAAGVLNSAGEIYCVVLVFKDISERKQYERKVTASYRFLKIGNRHTEMRPLLRDFTAEIKNVSGCPAVAVRVLNNKGEIPYAVADGFSEDFCRLEGGVTLHSKKGMCARVLREETDPDSPYFTRHGSYYVNSTTRVLAEAPADQKKRMRNTCHRFGFETLALIPIRSAGQILGLIHIASPEKDRLSPETVDILESASIQLGTSIRRVWIEEALQQSHENLETQVQQRTRQLSRTNDDLLAEIEQRRRTERELVKNQERLRSLSTELIQIQERERRRIAIDIHDRIGQALALAKMRLGALGAALDNNDLAGMVSDIKETVSQTIKDTRTLTFELSPPVLYDLGLQAALEWLADRMKQQSGLSVEVRGDGSDRRLDTGRRVYLFRAVGELLHNIVKHAGTDRAAVEIEGSADRITVHVTDPGSGFEPHALQYDGLAAEPGFGLYSIREQVRHYGGRFEIVSAPGRGSRIVLSMPPAENPAAGSELHHTRDTEETP